MTSEFTPISEKLLQFIWQFQYFNNQHLQTAEEDTLEVIHPGIYNTNQGPDFLEARIKIGITKWIGNIELHILSSDWNKHSHVEDLNYANIILHVVWKNDLPVKDKYGKNIPCLELQPLVSIVMLKKYTELLNNKGFVPCEKHLPLLNELAWLSWSERLVVERLHRKSLEIIQLFQESNHHWEETFWWLIARNFGIKVNAELFEHVARKVSVNLLAKHKNQIHQIEALLLGQAGLLHQTEFEESYPTMLKREYLFFQKKYGLQPLAIQPAFLRMRPANFPTVRLAQLAVLVHQSAHLFSKIKETEKVHELKSMFQVTANDYWHYHYRFDEITSYRPKNFGIQMVENVIINTIVPIVFAYGVINNSTQYKQKAIQWLNELPAEKNSITKCWESFSVTNNTAMASQGLIELKNTYCNHKQCLECAVGNKLLKQ